MTTGGRAVFPLLALATAGTWLVVGPAGRDRGALLERARDAERVARARLERRLQDEPRDALRSCRIGHDLRSALSALGQGEEATVERVDCGRSICRATLQTRGPDAELGRVLPLLGWQGTASFFEDAAEPGSVTLYLDDGGRRGVQAIAFP